MPTDLTSGNHELETLHLNHEPFAQTSQGSEPVPSAPLGPEIVPPDEAPTRTSEIGIILGLAVLVFFLSRFFGILREGEGATKHKATPTFSPATPCPSCRFFSRNIYLKCAVRPADVLTDRAIHCPDYYPYHSE